MGQGSGRHGHQAGGHLQVRRVHVVLVKPILAREHSWISEACKGNSCSGPPWLGPQVGEVHVSLATVDHGVGLLDGTVGTCLVCHRDKTVAAAFARLSVGDDDGFLDLAVDLEVLPKRLVGGVIRQAAHEYFGEGRVLLANACRLHGLWVHGGRGDSGGHGSRQGTGHEHGGVYERGVSK